MITPLVGRPGPVGVTKHGPDALQPHSCTRNTGKHLLSDLLFSISLYTFSFLLQHCHVGNYLAKCFMFSFHASCHLHCRRFRMISLVCSCNHSSISSLSSKGWPIPLTTFAHLTNHIVFFFFFVFSGLSSRTHCFWLTIQHVSYYFSIINGNYALQQHNASAKGFERDHTCNTYYMSLSLLVELKEANFVTAPSWCQLFCDVSFLLWMLSVHPTILISTFQLKATNNFPLCFPWLHHSCFI